MFQVNKHEETRYLSRFEEMTDSTFDITFSMLCLLFYYFFIKIVFRVRFFYCLFDIIHQNDVYVGACKYLILRCKFDK